MDTYPHDLEWLGMSRVVVCGKIISVKESPTSYFSFDFDFFLARFRMDTLSFRRKGKPN